MNLSVRQKPRRGRPASQSAGISGLLRERLAQGVWSPGERLPTRPELERELGVSNHTVQRTMRELETEGFIRSEGRGGTYVADHPPCHCCHGLVFDGHPYGYWSRLMDAICAGAETVSKASSPACRFKTYYDAGGRADTEAYARLLADVRAHRLAGLIFATPQFGISGSPLFTETQIPCVAVESNVDSKLPHVMARYPDLQSFTERAMKAIAADAGGRRRVAVLSYGITPRTKAIMATAREMGLRIEPWWVQTPQMGDPEAIAACVQLLLAGAPDQRPDALVITDDNYVEAATAALAAMNLRIPHDLLVVAHCNFPVPPPAAVPVVRLGFDFHALLHDATDSIAARRAGLPTPGRRLFPALFEHELEPVRKGSHGPEGARLDSLGCLAT